MSNTKYNPFKVMGKTSKNAIIKYLKADEKHNFETLANQLDKIFNELKQMSTRLTVIEKKLDITQQTE